MTPTTGQVSRPTPTGSGGAPAPTSPSVSAAEAVGRVRTALERLEGRTVGELAPFVDDLAETADALEAVAARVEDTPAVTAPPRPTTAMTRRPSLSRMRRGNDPYPSPDRSPIPEDALTSLAGRSS